MAKISLVQNSWPIVHVKELPSGEYYLQYGFNPSKMEEIPALRVHLKYFVKQEGKEVPVATYEAMYKIESEGRIIEDDIYACCINATESMRKLLQFDDIGRSIPPGSIQCPEKAVFQSDLVDLAKALNFFGGKRDNFPH